MKLKLEHIIFFVINIIFLTSSMDVTMNVIVFGFSLRFVFIAILFMIFFSLIYLFKIKGEKKLKFIGFVPFFIWFLFQVIFITNTTIFVRNVAYVAWLAIYLVFIPALSILIQTELQFIKLVKYYIQSFYYIAMFSIIQFFLGLFEINLFIQQWWLNGIPRASGFSYEPSYLATYMLLGWVICFYLIISKSKYGHYLRINKSIVFISLAIILSGSRMGILFIVGIPTLFIIYSMKSLFIKFQLSKMALRYFVAISLFLSTSVIYFTYNFDQAIIYLNGLGLFGTANHSYHTRTTDQRATFQAFKNSPIIGYSLGGLPTQIAFIKGKSISTQKEAKEFEGLNIFAEVLAASGIFGFLFFTYSFYLLFKKNINVSRIIKSFNPEFNKITIAILLAFFCELLILIFNQNILRAYLWVHIAIVNCLFYVMVDVIKHKYNSQNELTL